MSDREMPWAPSMRKTREVKITVVHGNGKTQIPEEIRRSLGLKDGDKIVWTLKNGEYCIRKVGEKPSLQAGWSVEPTENEVVEILRKRGLSTAEINEILRG